VFLDERRDRFYTMVKAMADVLKLDFDKADLQRLSYYPRCCGGIPCPPFL
jgi:hypothetical protein